MSNGALEAAVEFAQKIKHVFVATTAADGMPHIAAAGKLSWASPDRVAVAAWFCPSTMINLQGNHRLALVIWDPQTDKGYQLLGTMEKVEDLAMLDGYRPERISDASIPQVERQLLVHVEKILEFKHAPHTDRPQ